MSISSFRVCKAKTLSSGSSSDKKPKIPDAEVKPGIVDTKLAKMRMFSK